MILKASLTQRNRVFAKKFESPGAREWQQKKLRRQEQISKTSSSSARRQSCLAVNILTQQQRFRVDVKLNTLDGENCLQSWSGKVKSFNLPLSCVACYCSSGQDFSCHLLLYKLVDLARCAHPASLWQFIIFGCAKSNFTQNNIFADRGRLVYKESLELGSRPRNGDDC